MDKLEAEKFFVMSSSEATSRKGVLIIVENLPVPFDRRVWQEATALREAGYQVSVICPKGKGHVSSYEELQGIHIYRHPLPMEASGPMGYIAEYSAALFWEFVLSIKVLRKHGFDAVHACNPPDLIFLVGAFHKFLFGKKFIFDQHDVNPELCAVKFGRSSGPLYNLMRLLERLTFKLADATIATNETFKQIAIERGRMDPDKVSIVKSYPDSNRFRRIPPDPTLRGRFRFMAGYVGIMGQQDGVDTLIRAMHHIVHKNGRTDISCAIIGSGTEFDNLKALAQELQLFEYVNFTGFLTGETLLRHLCTLDIGVIPDPPNEFNDKLSMNKVFEYMMLGIPFVQFDLAQARFEADGAGVVAKDATPAALAAAMVDLLEDETKRQGLSARGASKAAAEFRWEREKRSLLELYSQVLS
jgi:glycosyltransferase involved in cell wall biosynthesis